jgi:hypothetical protein
MMQITLCAWTQSGFPNTPLTFTPVSSNPLPSKDLRIMTIGIRYFLARLSGALATAVGLLVVTPQAPATTVLPVNLAELTDNAGKAFVGTVVAQDVVAVGDGWGERITVEVHEGLRDAEPDSKVTWTQYRPGQQTRLPGMPEYTVGRTYLIFLSAPAPNSPYTAPVGLGQGVFLVTTASDGAVRARNQFNNAHVYAGLEMKQLGPAAAPKRASVKLQGGKTADDRTELASLVAQARVLSDAPGRNSVNRYGRPAREAVPLGIPGSPKAADELTTTLH